MTVLLVVLAAAAAMAAVERVAPGQRWPRVRGWWARAAALNGLQAGMVLLAGVAWDPWMAGHRPAWGAALEEAAGPAAAAGAGYVAIAAVYYAWHRARHASPFLWRWFHQVHHSPARIEIVTSFYKHPFELLANGLLSSAILFLGMGLSPAVAAQAVLVSGLAELFYHWNVSTPRWVGYVIQRPESHRIHHQEGLHSFNFADLPVLDMVFGTFRNAPRGDVTCGFGGDVEQRLPDMLMGRDISSEGAGGGSRERRRGAPRRKRPPGSVATPG